MARKLLQHGRMLVWAKRLQGSIFWGSVALAVPFAYASLYAAEGGPRDAKGCTGGAPPVETGVTRLSAEAEEQVANDAFVMINAEVRNTDVETALSSFTLEVRDAGGDLVEGTTEVLRDHVVTTGWSQVSIGWWADAAREPGERLALRASAMGSAGIVEFESELVVNDVAPVLVLPELELTSWHEVEGDMGASLPCPTFVDNCSKNFRAEIFVGRSLILSAPPVSEVAVGWEYRIEPIPGKGTFAATPPLYGAGPLLSYYVSLEFSEVLPEYCVRLVGRDLRTDQESSREWCATAAPPLELDSSSYDTIANCTSAPEGFEERWCRVKQLNSGLLLPECVAILDPSGGAGGQSGAVGEGGQPSAGESASDDSSSIVRTNAGCGCRTSRGTTTPAAALLVLAGAWIAHARRRTSRSLRSV